MFVCVCACVCIFGYDNNTFNNVVIRWAHEHYSVKLPQPKSLQAMVRYTQYAYVCVVLLVVEDYAHPHTRTRTPLGVYTNSHIRRRRA